MCIKWKAGNRPVTMLCSSAGNVRNYWPLDGKQLKIYANNLDMVVLCSLEYSLALLARLSIASNFIVAIPIHLLPILLYIIAYININVNTHPHQTKR